MKIEEKLNGWFRVGNDGFAKEVDKGLFDVIRTNDADDVIHVEFYDKVNISNERYGDDHEYLKLESSMEKAVYLAVFSLSYNENITCHNEQEVEKILVHEKVINKEEDFELYIV